MCDFLRPLCPYTVLTDGTCKVPTCLCGTNWSVILEHGRVELLPVPGTQPPMSDRCLRSPGQGHESWENARSAPGGICCLGSSQRIGWYFQGVGRGHVMRAGFGRPEEFGREVIGRGNRPSVAAGSPGRGRNSLLPAVGCWGAGAGTQGRRPVVTGVSWDGVAGGRDRSAEGHRCLKDPPAALVRLRG